MPEETDPFSPAAFARAGGSRHPESVIHEPAVIVDLARFRIGRGVRIDAYCYLLGGTGITLGDRTHLATGVSVGGGGTFTTGWCAGFAAGVRIVTGSDDPMQGLAGACIPPEFRHVQRGEVVVEDLAILFTNVVVLPGVRIGRGAVVSAGTIVNRSLEPWGVYAGTPARRLGTRDSALVEREAARMKDHYGF
jgi:acetyltransferase-like isoleucine patch superfamily enzyme